VHEVAVILGPAARAAGLVPGTRFNLGKSEDDFRAPDVGLHRPDETGDVWNATAALVVEIVSPGDESWEKLPFFADHDVDEVLIVDPAGRSVHWLALEGGDYREIDRRGLIDLSPADLRQRIDWPE
jgi:Uma2 family endonuclease